jgi:hypothetical protein
MIFRLKETVTLPQTHSLVKRGSSFDASSTVWLPADETAAPSRLKALKEKRLGKALLNFRDVNRRVSGERGL